MSARSTKIRRLAEGRCVDCNCDLLPEWNSRCPECNVKQAAYQRKWKIDNPEKWQRLSRASGAAAVARDRARGLCRVCGASSEVRADGRRRDRCIACTAVAAEYERGRQQRRRSA